MTDIFKTYGIGLSATEQLIESIRRTQDLQRSVLAPYTDLQTPARKALEQMDGVDAVRRAAMGNLDAFSQVHQAIAGLTREWALPKIPFVEEVLRAAEIAQSFQLPNPLVGYQSPFEHLSLQLAQIPCIDLRLDTTYLATFGQASALSNLFDTSSFVTKDIVEGARAFQLDLSFAGTLGECRQLLDATGLILPRWPRIRRLSAAEKRRRFREKLAQNAEPAHIKKAKSLVHRYELTLRNDLEEVMAVTYGDDWPHDRLPLCDCKGLLGRWKARGGMVLDHADYAHYAAIVSNEQHFADIFHVAFADPDEAFELLNRAGNLRAASHHGRPFTPEDLVDLRLTWRQIEKGLLALDPGYDFEY